jgi:hypothetical protein
VSQALDRIRQVASQRTKEKFTALLHHVSLEYLEAAFFQLKENAAPGVDGPTWQANEADLDRNIADLHARLHRGAYRMRGDNSQLLIFSTVKSEPRGPLPSRSCKDLIVNAIFSLVTRALVCQKKPACEPAKNGPGVPTKRQNSPRKEAR